MKPRVAVIDYGLGNLHSVQQALVHVGAEVSLVKSPQDLANADRLVLPGVGAFADGMAGLASRGLRNSLCEYAASNRPLLGICLGAQLMLGESEEFGLHAGLGLIPGRVARIPSQAVKVPHVGWNRLCRPEGVSWAGTPLAATEMGAWAYFVHSFMLVPADPKRVLASFRYGSHTIAAAVGLGRVVGFQFHPEKSGQAGLEMLRTFVGQPL